MKEVDEGRGKDNVVRKKEEEVEVYKDVWTTIREHVIQAPGKTGELNYQLRRGAVEKQVQELRRRTRKI